MNDDIDIDPGPIYFWICCGECDGEVFASSVPLCVRCGSSSETSVVMMMNEEGQPITRNSDEGRELEAFVNHNDDDEQ